MLIHVINGEQSLARIDHVTSTCALVVRQSPSVKPLPYSRQLCLSSVVLKKTNFVHSATGFYWKNFSSFVATLGVPGIVNRTFENRTQSNSIRGLSSIEFGNRTKSNTTLSVSSISEQIELNPSDCVRLSSETELNRTQLNGFRSIGSGEPIQSKPKSSPSKQVFLALFLLFI